MTGDRIGRQLSLATRRELIEAIAERYHAAGRTQKKQILNEFIKVAGYHRKHAIRALRRASGKSAEPAPRSRLYNEAVRSRRGPGRFGCVLDSPAIFSWFLCKRQILPSHLVDRPIER